MTLSVKMAATPHEFAQIHRLNYQTFVEEIPQHVDKINEEGVLIDKFHHKNTYFIVKEDEEVIGMVCYCDQRPFSVETKLPEIQSYLDSSDIIAPCEMRLLAVKQAYRHRKEIVIYLLDACIEYAFAVKAIDCALVTAYAKQISLYQSLGFQAIGPMLASGDAQFQVMGLKLHELPLNSILGRFIERRQGQQAAYFLTGPVLAFDGVDEAAKSPAISHRSADFVEIFQETCDKLKRLVNTNFVHVTMGNGSLANGIVAAQLAALNTPGLILTNGEFSERLVDHAHRAKLDFKQIKKSWGESFSEAEIEQILKDYPDIDWIWTTHCETSTGMLNDIEYLKMVGRSQHKKIVLDCMSSIGTIPVDLADVYLASCSSAKALGAKTGLAFVFYNHEVKTASCAMPAVFDLGCSQSKNGIPFTISSHLIVALKQALLWFDNVGVWKRTRVFSQLIRQTLLSYGIVPLLDETQSSPAIITLPLPKSLNSYILGEQFAEKGVLLNYGSDYLRARNWLQISLMGNFYYRDIVKLLRSFDLLTPLGEQSSLSALSV